MTDGTVESRRLNPWLVAWREPQTVIKDIIARRDRRWLHTLAAGAGVAVLLESLQSPIIHWFAVLVAALLAGPVIGLVQLYLSGALAAWGGRLLGGAAGQADMRTVFAWSWLPHVAAAVLLIACFVAFQGAMLRPAVLVPVSVVVILLSLWSFVLAVRMVGAVQNFGLARSILNTLAPTLLIGLAALVVRVFFYQPFNVPAGSMQPTLLIGDYFYVDKLAYGISRYSFPFDAAFEGRILPREARRGDLVVFALPRDPSTIFVKRIVGLPGDSIVLKRGVLVINGAEAASASAGHFESLDSSGRPETVPVFTETLPDGPSYTVIEHEIDGPFDTAGPYKVPAAHYFMLGDNRDNSVDSRSPEVGFVPADNLIGRVSTIFFSAAETTGREPLAQAFDNIRWGRIGRFPR